jgi:protein-L-isoaspartate O-methyltransferase
MATKAPDHTMTEPNFASAEYAEQWCRGKRLRGETSVAATEMMLDLAKIQLGDHVLELAAGTGDLAVMTARRVGPSGHVLATDISANMLNLAAEAVREAGLTNVETRVMERRISMLRPILSMWRCVGPLSCFFPTQPRRWPVSTAR